MATEFRMTRRAALAGAAVLAGRSALAQPAVRKRVAITYWTWSDNPAARKMVLDSVEMFNKSQDFVTVSADADSQTMAVRQKVVAAFAAGAAPDVAGVVQTHVQNYFDNDILYPIEELFNKSAEKDDYFDSIKPSMRSKPGQPLLYLPTRILPYVLYYRADWFAEAGIKAPETYDAFIEAARRIAAPERVGYAMRGVDYYAVQPIEPIWGSAGVKFVDEAGKVDFDSPAAIDVTAKWVGMFTRDKSAQATAVTDGYAQLYALMEKGRAAMWMYGTHASPQLIAALGDRVQGVPIPPVGAKKLMLANPEGEFMTTACKEKEAAWELMKFMGQGQPLRWRSIERGFLPVRKSYAADPAITNNRFFKIAMDNAPNWWTPPFAAENWANYQDKIAPYWQQALRQEITPAQWNQQAAKFLRGQG